MKVLRPTQSWCSSIYQTLRSRPDNIVPRPKELDRKYVFNLSVRAVAHVKSIPEVGGSVALEVLSQLGMDVKTANWLAPLRDDLHKC